MANLTLSVPKELKRRMESFPEMNWSEVARQAFMQKIADLELLRDFKSRSAMTEEDALRMGRKLNQALSKRYKNINREGG